MSKVSLAACAALVIGAVPASACEGDTRVTVNRPATLQGTLKTGKGEHDAQGPCLSGARQASLRRRAAVHAGR
jgi:hypothetical protein